jgi:1,4-alpha-glucan branching enzyme
MARKAITLKKQIFRITGPEAETVLLVGDFTDWQQRAIPMKKGNDGIWTATVKLPPGTYNYLFIVDGEWCEDPDCSVRLPNPFGGYNMVRQVALT